MKKNAISVLFIMALSQSALAQTIYDSKTLVDTNNNSTSTSTVNTTNNSTSASTSTNTSTVNSTSTNTNNNNNTSTSVNTNNNINSGTQTFNNNNNSTSTSTNTNTNHNINSGTQTFNNNNLSTSTNTNTNNNNNVSTSNNVNTNIQQGEITNKNLNSSTIDQTLRQPPPTAIAPAMMSGGNNDLCTTGTSGSVQTQILGVSSGGTVRDLNCERLKNAKTLFDMGMKVAAVATLCQDRRVFDAMWHAGTPCPYEGEIGARAKELWNNNLDKWPQHEIVKQDDFYKKTGFGALLGAMLFKLF